MHHLKRSIRLFSIITLITTITLSTAVSQSGRGRPKVPQPSPSTTAPPPQPVKVPEAAAVTRQEQAGTTSRFVLRNGITVVISEQHSTPIVAAVAYFKAGTRDEPPGTTGMARLVAHLIPKGTVLRPGDRAIADLRALGASLEVTTTHEGTAYSLMASFDKIRDALAIQADMLQNPVLDAEAARREVPLVIEEERSGAVPRGVSLGPGDGVLTHLTSRDGPAAYSMTRLFNLAFAGGAPANPDALSTLARDKLVDFYRSHYRPENLIVAVTGDVSTFNTLVDIQQLYGEFGAKPAPKAEQSSTTSSTEQQRLRYATDRSDITQSIVSAGFHVPGVESKDSPAIEVLAALIGQGRASRLGRSLIDGRLAAGRVESNYTARAGASLLTIQMWVSPDSREGSSIDKAESAMFKELDRLRREVPTEAEMARAKTVLEKRWVDETGTYLGRAQALAHAEAAGVGLQAVLDYRTRIRAVRAEDVQRAAAKYFTLANVSLRECEPFTAATRTFDADTFAATVSAWAPGFAEGVDRIAVRGADVNSSLTPVAQGTERPPERQALIESVQPLAVKDFSTLNGTRAFVREDHSQQKVTVALLFQGGRLVEDASTSGTTELMLRSILYGTPRRTFSQVSEELDGLGADVRIVVEPDFFGLLLSVLSRNADRALKLLRDEIEEPAFRNDDVARARLGQIAAIRDARDSSFARSHEMVLQALFPGHAYSLPPHGREEVVRALTSEKLGEWYARAIKRQLPVAIIVGDTDGSALVSSQIAEAFKRRELDTAIQVKTPQPASAAEKVEPRRRDETTVAVGLRGPKADSADLAALQLIDAAMNGQGGRLLAAYKENSIWSASLGSEAMFVAGVIFANVKSSPETEQRARAILLAELDRVARGGLAEDELASARALAATARNALLQSQSERALDYARAVFYRKQATDVDDFEEQVSKMTAADIKRVAMAYFKVSTASSGVVRGNAESTRQPSSK